MTSRILQILAVAVLVLLAVLFLLERDGGNATTQQLLFPDLRAQVEDVHTLRIGAAGQDDVEIRKAGDGWTVLNRENYPADMSKVRSLLLALTDAEMIEAKTSNPELYSRLGLDDPEQHESGGIRVTLEGGEAGFSVILGDTAQSDNRFARRQDEDRAWLIDQRADVPLSAAEWLAPEIVDIDANRIRSLTITHPDEEHVRIRKDSSEDIDFEVIDIPDGRELSYSTVANGIAGALNDLQLDDVRKGTSLPDAVLTEFETFDGLTILVRTAKEESANWISVNASGDDGVSEEAANINAGLAGWQYRIADFKADLFTRRWEDILKPVD